MFCSNCGSKLTEGALFCHQCGAKVNGTADTVQISQADSGKGLEHEALKIYLGDVLAFECIVNKFSKKASEQNDDISGIKRNNYCQSYIMDSYVRNRAYFLYDGNNINVLTTERGNRIESSHCYTDSVWTRVEDILKIINVNDTWDEFVSSGYGFFEAKKQRNIFKEKFLNSYSDFKRNAPAEYQKNLKKISDIKYNNKKLCKEWDEARAILQKLYQVNIIPQSFRNDLYAIYYLHNFVTTCNMPFETALLHYNLEEIKTKLDTIIKQQQEIIINQAITIAQNKALCEQNQRQLEKLSDIESNTYSAAQYAEIAAKNAEAVAWISLANYIGK